MAANRNKLIVGNWKMNCLLTDGITLAKALTAGAPKGVSLAICPPFTLLHEVSALLKNSEIALGAQDCHHMPSGAYTGDISTAMLADVGCRYVIVGHSERRKNHGETNAIVRMKAAAALTAGLIPIICIGETAEQRENGKTAEVICQQLLESLPENTSQIVVAYEPVWAIGSGNAAPLTDIQEMHSIIRKAVKSENIPILYGGSVKPENAAAILSVKNVDGALVGGASLNAQAFLAIAKNA